MAADSQAVTTMPAIATQEAAPPAPAHSFRTLHVDHFFDGVILSLAMVAALLFMRLYRRSREPYLIYFAAALFVFGLNKILHQFYTSQPDTAQIKTWLYAVRIVVFALILLGLFDKSRRRSSAAASKNPS